MALRLIETQLPKEKKKETPEPAATWEEGKQKNPGWPLCLSG